MNETPNNRLLKALGQRIRELRTERGYSQESFADKCGVHRTFMGTVERGESNLSFQNILKVATALGITLSKLFMDIEVQAKVLAANPVGTPTSSESQKNAHKAPPRS